MSPPPVRVALAAAVRTLPRAAGLAYEPKFDGHRMVVLRTEEDVVLQARSGRIVTGAFPDLAAAARQLPAGTVLDGEVVVWHAGRTDFALVQRRAAAANAARAAVLAQSLPASYAAFDVLELAGVDVRGRPYERRRALLVDLLLPLGPPLQPVPMTTDPELAETWYETLPASGIEGLVVKRLDQPYPAGRRAWRKLRHTNVRDAAVIGYTGTPRRPLALVLVLPGEEDEAPLVSSPLSEVLRTELAAALAERGPAPAGGGGAGGATVTAIGLGEVPFRLLDPPLAAEVRHSSVRHPPPEVLRLRTDL
ncbi:MULTISPECIES: ATP-dependent DNA ligase [Streptomyces]|uniref:ATP-dependent DNA ligase n=1 Tax=Streptomyces katrae TaxID=68223 RepID=A0ABT7GMA5_9ACTN|nr:MULTISPECIES: ATP-dependent DNA ligase [Streptomyces]MDK9494709.1 ATP-dependent DNA ligase [Streptomyces katrae]RST03568.1 ATP-dependent DNA ligase [Streptomyces sp. WAC07149]GLX20373.1 DNA ligase [Streptomyces lavendulae subsp. lavendulae]GLX26928.1 DNA ligase [Streptomyces lavendulae subsp. lavendulae]